MRGLEVQALSHKDSEQDNCRTHYKGDKKKERKKSKQKGSNWSFWSAKITSMCGVCALTICNGH